MVASIEPAAVNPTPVPIHSKIVCKVCDTGHLTPITVHRLSGVSVGIGYLIVIPSVLSAVVGALTGMENSHNGYQVMIAIGWVIGSIMAGLLGFVLTMKKSVLRCDRCRACVETA